MCEINNNIPHHLPPGTGPYVPGCMDVMLDYTINGLFMRLYYPTKAKQNETKYNKWPYWLPSEDYLLGTAKAILVWPFFLRMIGWVYSVKSARIPALYGEKVNTDKKLKCIILSHGYASTRFFYSSICCELASQGYLVATPEHRDYTCGYTYYYESKENVKSDIRKALTIKHIKFGEGHLEQRNRQVRFRAEECSKLLDFLIDLDNGKISPNILDDIRTDDEINFKLEDLVGNLDTENITMAGHSFGGATALMALSQRKEFKLGILLDPWMFPLKSEEEQMSKISQPILTINTQTFHNSPNVKMMEKYLLKPENEMYTILHTTHENQCDSVCVMGYWLNWFMKKLNPVLALRINNALMVRFLAKQTAATEDIKNSDKVLADEKLNFAIGLTKPWA